MVQYINIALLPMKMKSTSSIAHFSPSARYLSSVYKSLFIIYLFIFVYWYVNHTKMSLLLLSAVNTSLVRMDAAAEFGRNPVSKHQIQPEYGDEQADAGRDCRSRLVRPNSLA